MGMSLHVQLFRDGSCSEHQAMVCAVKALKKAGVTELPQKMKTYFGISCADEYIDGMRLEAGTERGLFETGIVERYYREGAEGFDVYVDKIPDHVSIIRFTASY